MNVENFKVLLLKDKVGKSLSNHEAVEATVKLINWLEIWSGNCDFLLLECKHESRAVNKDDISVQLKKRQPWSWSTYWLGNIELEIWLTNDLIVQWKQEFRAVKKDDLSVQLNLIFIFWIPRKKKILVTSMKLSFQEPLSSYFVLTYWLRLPYWHHINWYWAGIFISQSHISEVSELWHPDP